MVAIIPNFRLQSQLMRLPLQIKPFPSAYMAARILHHHTPDLIILDEDQSSMTGFDVCERLRHIARFRETPILVLVRELSERNRTYAQTTRVTKLILKPPKEEDFVPFLPGGVRPDLSPIEEEVAYAELQRRRDGLQEGIELRGKVTFDRLFLLLEMLQRGTETGRLKLSLPKGVTGVIVIKDGQPQHAVCGVQTGLRAVSAIFSKLQGAVGFVFETADLEGLTGGMDISMENLLLEVAVTIDHSALDSAPIP